MNQAIIVPLAACLVGAMNGGGGVLHELFAPSVALASTVRTLAPTDTTFYVSNLPGSGCNDDGPGTNGQEPWCSFKPAAQLRFAPGDQLLLRRGGTWNEELDLEGSGTAERPIVLGAYGTGPKPRILRDGNNAMRGPVQRAVLLTNPSNWRIEDLEVGNAEVGIMVFYDSLGHRNLVFRRIDTHDIHGIVRGGNVTSYGPLAFVNFGDCSGENTFRGVYESAGILITGEVSFDARHSAVRGVTMEDITGTRNNGTIGFSFCGGVGASDGSSGTNLIRDVTLRDLHFYDGDGGGEAPQCREGLEVINVENAFILDSTFDRQSACTTGTGTAAIMLGRTSGVHLVNSVVVNTPETLSPDETGVDYEALTFGTEVRGSYLAGNAGAGLEVQALPGRPGDHQVEFQILGNTFANGKPPTFQTLLLQQQGSVEFNGVNLVPTGLIAGNASADRFFLFNPLGTDLSGVRGLDDNVRVVRGRIHNAPSGFGGPSVESQWRYESSTDGGVIWSPLSWHEPTQTWRGGDGDAPAISRYDQVAPACGECRVARSFVVPDAGKWVIRGNALRAWPLAGPAPAGVQVVISHNGEPLLGPLQLRDAPNTGVLTNVDVFAQEGDVVRFEVAVTGDEGDTVSWTPTVSYGSEKRVWEWDPTDQAGSPFGPGPPTDVEAIAGDGSARVSFTPPAANGRSPVVAYTAMAFPGGQRRSGATGPLEVLGLRNGVSYTFRVFATDEYGFNGPLSDPSEPVTPSGGLLDPD